MNAKSLIKKILFWSFTLTMFAALLGTAYLFRSITPLYEIDESSNKIALFGGKYKLDFKRDVQPKIKVALQEENYRVSLDGDIAAKDFHTISIDAEQTDMSLEAHGKKLIYHCRASKQEKGLIEASGDKVKLKISGEAICQVIVPEKKKLAIVYRSGLLRLHSIEQDIDLEISDGMVIWGSGNYSRYKLDLDVDQGHVYGNHAKFKDKSDNDKGLFSANLHVKNAIIFFR
ncbi:MAG: hypothetical protein A2X86_18265 [Bdellovibrionales bacterium GWA2_49_15]|nr:MAG: hypothetical protein A2X86_18265 [Bdellovibrionales bacterium GWA2_49_15]HAZ11669.1 hypothetical protein [Bdellovibrionales bacterium]